MKAEPRRGLGGPPAVSDKQALSIIAKIKGGKSSVMEEARRLGCYHATLRKAMRAVLGSRRYDKLMGAKTVSASTVERKRYKVSKPPRAKPDPVGLPPTTKPQRYPKPKAPTFGHVEDPFLCGRCHSPHLKTGTDGNGGGILWCSCGWSRAIPRVRAAAAVVV